MDYVALVESEIAPLLRGENQDLRYFLSNAYRYNVYFQMTSFGANIIEKCGFNPRVTLIFGDKSVNTTFLRFYRSKDKFRQIYLMGYVEDQRDQCQTINNAMKRESNDPLGHTNNSMLQQQKESPM